ncbi:MAG: homoserine kinase [Acidobacteriota bacterium]
MPLSPSPVDRSLSAPPLFRSPQPFATARAPASIANIGVGFDVLGHSFDALHDRVRVRRIDERRVTVKAIHSMSATCVDVAKIPLDAERNTAARAVDELCRGRNLRFGFEIEIDKGIPLAAGLGGSAASAVAAVVAAAELVDDVVPEDELYHCALVGEAAASGAQHGDNVAASLRGGLVSVGAGGMCSLALPDGIHVVVVRPDCQLPTKEARAALSESVGLHTHVSQSSRLLTFALGCERDDLDLIRASFGDEVAEPARARYLPHLETARHAALDHGALGAGISGAGPSVFAWFPPHSEPNRGAVAMAAAVEQAGYAATIFEARLSGQGAKVVS